MTSERALAAPGLRLSSRTVAVLAFGAYLAFALYITWPWVLDPSDRVYGVIGGDLTANLAQYQQFVDEMQPPFLPGETTSLNAPEGLENSWGLNIAGFGSSATLFVLSLAFGSVAAHGIVAIAGFALSAFAMFLLARWITGHAGAAFIAGLAFGFWPYMYVTGWTWPHYIHTWVFVLALWRMLVVIGEPTVRNGLLAGAATAVAMTWIQYNLLIAGVLFATLAIVGLVSGWRSDRLARQLRAQAAAATVVGAVAAVVLLAAAVQDFKGLPLRTAEDASANSARPLMYLLPSPRHPLLGDSVGEWLEDKYSNPFYAPTSTAAYAEIYLGAFLMLLAVAGVLWLAVRVRRGGATGVAPRVLLAGVSAAAIALVGLVFSAPPRVEILGVSVPLPYSVISEVTTAFRAAHRFALLVVLGLCVLAAIAVAALIRGRALAVQAAVVALLAFVMATDLWAEPDVPTADIVVPRIYELLREQPPGIVAEYQFRDPAWVQAVDSLHQDAHEHPLFTGFDRGTESESRKLELRYLLEDRTVRDLARYGVRYVVVHDAGEGRPEWLPRPGDRIPGLELIGGYPEAALYRVTARPSSFTSYAISGFAAPEGDPPAAGRWLTANGGKLELRGDCAPCTGVVSFAAASFNRERALTIRGEDGRVLYEGVLSDQRTRLSFPVRFSRRITLTFSTEPPPAADNPAYGIFVWQPIRFERR